MPTASAASTAAASSVSVLQEVYGTFLASIRSVGTACTLAAVGVYLHQRGYVVGNGKRTLALISQQVTIPLLFFTKILYCNQDWSTDPCPNVTRSLRDVWVLLVWPLYVCGTGVLVGWACARLAGVRSRSQIQALLVSVGFGNSTGLPITLLTVIHSNFPTDTDMGRIDPTLFLSVYLLLYPVLQWGIGGWMLAPPENNGTKDGLERSTGRRRTGRRTCTNKKNDGDDHGGGGGGGDYDNTASTTAALTHSADTATISNNLDNNGGGGGGGGGGSGRRHSSGITDSFMESLTRSNGHRPALAHNVLNRSDKMPQSYQISHRGLSSVDASLYMSIQENLNRWGRPISGRIGSYEGTPTGGSPLKLSRENSIREGSEEDNGNTEGDLEAGIGMDLSDTDNGNHNGNVNGGVTHFHKRISSSHSDERLFEAMKRDSKGTLNETKLVDTETTTTAAEPSETSALLPPPQSQGRPSGGGGGAIDIEIKKQDGGDDANGTGNTSTPNTSSSDTEDFNSNNNNDADDHNDDDDDDDDVSDVMDDQDAEHCCVTFGKVVQRCLQPPVTGALLGLLVASFPKLRGIFVDIYDRNGDAPLEWLFDGLYAVGQAAVPINMIILGCNLSASYMLDAGDPRHRSKFFSPKASMAVVVGKMVVMPVIGYASAYVISLVYHVPAEISGSFYLVLIVVFLCPTANNVMVMVELSGNGSKEGMARIIALQYMVAPIVLSLTVTVAVFMALSMK